MGQIIADVAKDATTEDLHGCEPVVEEDGVGKFPERSRQNHKQCWWHDQSITVHGQVVVNTVKEEVESQTDSVVRKPPRKYTIRDFDTVECEGEESILVKMEQEAVVVCTFPSS
mgnify:CR=1 FL=1